jgi:putative salt-induced outer membrane protein YdiY
MPAANVTGLLLACVRNLMRAICLVGVLAAGVVPANAQSSAAAPAKTPAEPKLGWSNATDLSLVLTSGNSAARTLGFADHLKHVWANARFEFDVTGVRSDTSDDRYFLVAPGLEFPVGAQPSNPPTSLVKPGAEPDVSNYLVGGHYQRNITPKFYWDTGARWDRNRDAGILHRTAIFAGVGNTWADNDQRRFITGYGVSYTDRVEEDPDPEKDQRFGGLRANWAYTEHLGTTTTLDSVLVTNMSLADAGDFSIDTTNGVSVSMNGHLALKASLQWLYEHEPALETGLDVIAYVDLVDPDGMAGTGDEYYRTVDSGRAKIVVGSADARKDRLDTIVRTALVITF